jgi:hypothetical protein
MAYYTRRHLDGTVVIEQCNDGYQRRPLVLVVNGPERGHLWWDCRSVAVGPTWLERMYRLGGTPTQAKREPGIHPVMRRGPFSLLAWLEGAVDHLSARIDDLYARLPNITVTECSQLMNEAFMLHSINGME